MELFLVALIRNTLATIPTGSGMLIKVLLFLFNNYFLGKTHVAFMATCTMKELNPDKVVIMVVNRIPLVEQQAKYAHFQHPLYPPINILKAISVKVCQKEAWRDGKWRVCRVKLPRGSPEKMLMKKMCLL
jgi:ERCC4-related helicase